MTSTLAATTGARVVLLAQNCQQSARNDATHCHALHCVASMLSAF